MSDIDPLINAMYNSLLGRSPDQGGGQYWTDQLRSGMSLQQIQSAIRGSSEWKQSGGINLKAPDLSVSDVLYFQGQRDQTEYNYSQALTVVMHQQSQAAAAYGFQSGQARAGFDQQKKDLDVDFGRLTRDFDQQFGVRGLMNSGVRTQQRSDFEEDRTRSYEGLQFGLDQQLAAAGFQQSQALASASLAQQQAESQRAFNLENIDRLEQQRRMELAAQYQAAMS